MTRPSDSIERNRVLGVTPTSTADTEPSDKKMGGEEHELSGRDGATIQMTEEGIGGEIRTYRTYKRRWFGLAQLMLLNIVVSWDVSQTYFPPHSTLRNNLFNKKTRTNISTKPQWLTFAPVAESAATYYNVSQTAINWLSTAFMLAFPVIAPLTIKILHLGPRPSIMASAALVLAGNWIRYAGSYKVEPSGGIFGVVMFGQILTGLAQPFVLAAPTRYSDMWFTTRGRVAATAATSLANPLGAALGQLIVPELVKGGKSEQVSKMVLYVAIIVSEEKRKLA